MVCFTFRFCFTFRVFKDVFADCNFVEKEHRGMFYLLKIAFQRSSSGKHILKKTAPTGASEGLQSTTTQIRPAAVQTKAHSVIYSWHINL